MTSLKEICGIIEELSGKQIVSENKNVSGPMEFVTDISKIKNLTGWEPKYSINDGLRKTFNIMSEYHKKINILL